MRRRKRLDRLWRILRTGCAPLLLAGAGAQAEGQAGGAEIVHALSGGRVVLEVFATLPEGTTGRYELLAEKLGPSGRSSTRQAGRVPAGDGTQSGPLTTARISLGPGETLEAALHVRTDSGETFVDRVAIGGD